MVMLMEVDTLLVPAVNMRFRLTCVSKIACASALLPRHWCVFFVPRRLVSRVCQPRESLHMCPSSHPDIFLAITWPCWLVECNSEVPMSGFRIRGQEYRNGVRGCCEDVRGLQF